MAGSVIAALPVRSRREPTGATTSEVNARFVLKKRTGAYARGAGHRKDPRDARLLVGRHHGDEYGQRAHSKGKLGSREPAAALSIDRHGGDGARRLHRVESQPKPCVPQKRLSTAGGLPPDEAPRWTIRRRVDLRSPDRGFRSRQAHALRTREKREHWRRATAFERGSSLGRTRSRISRSSKKGARLPGHASLVERRWETLYAVERTRLL